VKPPCVMYIPPCFMVAAMQLQDKCSHGFRSVHLAKYQDATLADLQFMSAWKCIRESIVPEDQQISLCASHVHDGCV
jgi:hypothetical protein